MCPKTIQRTDFSLSIACHPDSDGAKSASIPLHDWSPSGGNVLINEPKWLLITHSDDIQFIFNVTCIVLKLMLVILNFLSLHDGVLWQSTIYRSGLTIRHTSQVFQWLGRGGIYLKINFILINPRHWWDKRLWKCPRKRGYKILWGEKEGGWWREQK